GTIELLQSPGRKSSMEPQVSVPHYGRQCESGLRTPLRVCLPVAMPAPPSSRAHPYVGKVLSLYLELPETPLRTNLYDQKCAAELQFRSVPLDLIEAAFLLGSLRRLLRPPGALPLSPIRSLAYFQPVIDELLACPLSNNYVGYLRSKMKPFARKKLTESMEKDSTYRLQK